MKFTIDPRIFSEFDNPRIAVVVVRGADNQADVSRLQPRIEELCEKVRQQYGATALSQLPNIASWREAYRDFGSKPKDYSSSIESLLRRVLKGETVTGISPLVDIYNYISIKYMLPAGGEDTDAMQGDLTLTFASTDEQPVTVLGRSEPQAPYEGEVIYKDDIGTICRRWNWREVSRTILKSNTKNCILVLEALNPTTDNELEDAQNELADLVKEYCQATVELFMLNPAHDSITLSS